jgi:hypothetical protein
MGTFNDFENTVEETLRVDLRNRITPQEVKFINRKNKFYGTFDGEIKSSGAKLDNVEITNAKFYDEEGNLQDVNELLKMGGRLDEVEKKVEEDIPELIDKKVLESQGVVSDKIDELEKGLGDLGTKVNVLSGDAFRKIDETRTELDEKIDGVNKELKSEIDATIDLINDEAKEREEEIGKLSVELKDDISKVDNNLNGRIDGEVFDKIAKDRHYVMNDVSNVDVNYRLKDFAVNFIDTDVADGVVFGTSKIGKITNVIRDEEGKIKSLDFITFNDFNDPTVEGCFPPYSQRYTLDETKPTFGGWQVSLVSREEKLEDTKISLSFHATGGCTIKTPDGIQVGRIIYDEYDSDGNLVSGKIELLPGTASPLSSVNGESFTFNETVHDKYVTDKDTGLKSRITVVPGLKKIHVKTGIRMRSELPLRNELAAGIRVGYIENGDISEDSVKLHITDAVDSQLTGTYELEAGEAYRHQINRDYAIDYLTDEKVFRIYRDEKFYRYSLTVVNSSEESKTTNATVEPDTANYRIDEDGIDSVTFSFTDGEIPMFGSKMVKLERNDDFTKVVKNDDGDKLVIEYDERLLRVVANVYFSRGGDWKKNYVIDADTYEVVPGTITTVVKTQPIDLENPVFEEAEDDGEYNVDLEIGPHVTIEEEPKTLTIKTDNANSLTLETPKDEFIGTDMVSREFITIFDITGDEDDGFVQLKFTDGVKIINHVVDGEKDDLFIKRGRRSMFMFRQVRNDGGFETYLVTDLNVSNVTGLVENNLTLIEELSGDVNDNYFKRETDVKQVIKPEVEFLNKVTIQDLDVLGTFKAQREEAKVIVTELSAKDATITDLFVDSDKLHYGDAGKTAKEINDELSNNIKAIDEKVDELSGDYHSFYDSTFKRVDIDEQCELSCDSLIVTDEEVSGSGHGVHDRYRMAFMDGTLVLIKEEI